MLTSHQTLLKVNCKLFGFSRIILRQVACGEHLENLEYLDIYKCSEITDKVT